jgi:beta-phosphoglucomutase family hydrolase
MGFGLPSHMRACLFDLDGVLTPTAKVHAAAWKEMFDEYLRARARPKGVPFVPFDKVGDYDRYVDGKPRVDGTRSFLAARGIELPEGRANDPPEAETVRGLGRRKNEIVLRLLQERRVAPYEGSLRYVRAVRGAGLLTAVVSSSRNCRLVLASAGITDLFGVIVDGVVGQDMKLGGKPAPDTYLAAARMLDVSAAQSAVFEDALSGVEAGRAGGFGFVVGVDRIGQSGELLHHGASVVVKDLAELVEAT